MIYITGDKHGSHLAYADAIEQIDNPTEEDVIIVCGDAGLEYGGQVMGSCRKVMKKFPGSWLIMRGNHDNRYWRDHMTQDGWNVSYKFDRATLVQKKYSNIHYVVDGGDVYNIDGHIFLMIPGAYSVDKHYRLRSGLPYEPEEQLTPEEMRKLLAITEIHKDKIEFVCGHTFPRKIEPKLKYLFMDIIDQSSVDKGMEDFLDKVMEIVEGEAHFKQYFGAHFHDDKVLSDKYTILYNTVAKMEDYIGN